MILELELLSDVALTATSATVDAHETLTYIPGQCLLGAAASTLYAKAHDEGIAWELFHSGAVRYGCALPVNARGEVAWPMPLSLQRPKGADAVSKDGRLTDVVVNLAHPDARDPEVQYARVGEGYLDVRGAVLRPETALSMRTAIGAQGRVRDGFLFTLSAMARGTRLVAEVASDDPAHLARLRPVFDGTTLRVGRSRNAEFGALKVTVKDGTSRETMPAPREHHPATSLTFWCLTDVCLRDPATDQPTLVPAREHFGLPEGWRYAGSGSSVQLRYVGDRWVLTTVTESTTEGEHECVVFDVSYLSSVEGTPGMKMKYRVFWRLEQDDPVGVWRPWVARFAGWEPSTAGRG